MQTNIAGGFFQDIFEPVYVESSRQVEIGGTVTTKTARLDLVLFQNAIANRITTVPTGPTTSRYQNNISEIVVEGLEVQAEADVLRTFGFNVGYKF